MFKNKLCLDTARCTLCRTCLFICPSNALDFIQKENGVEIVNKTNLCKYPCQICKDKCPTKAINIERKLFFTYFPNKQDKYFIKYALCGACGSLAEPSPIAGRIICPNCRRKLTAFRHLNSVAALKNRRKSK